MLREALVADIEMIEVDLWFRAGRIEARHELRLGWLPVLADKRPRGPTGIGPWAVPLPRGHYARLDLRPLLLPELLQTTSGTKRLLLDLKAVDAGPAEEFAKTLAREIERADARASVAVCGQFWPVLDSLREVAPEIEVRYSMQAGWQWGEYVRRLDTDMATRAVCMHHGMASAERTAFLEANGVDVYCWTVDDAAMASALVERGVDGVISNDLALLAGLRSGRG
jgi:glycerophosphoryl diester phosphodiesterase